MRVHQSRDCSDTFLANFAQRRLAAEHVKKKTVQADLLKIRFLLPPRPVAPSALGSVALLPPAAVDRVLCGRNSPCEVQRSKECDGKKGARTATDHHAPSLSEDIAASGARKMPDLVCECRDCMTHELITRSAAARARRLVEASEAVVRTRRGAAHARRACGSRRSHRVREGR